jgi:hypothetical protein
MICEDHVFVDDVVVIDPTWETMAMSVIIQPTCLITKLITIAKICKYKRFHEGHNLIPMAMGHNAPEHDMDHFI